MAVRLETVPARHGTATFVPSGCTIKIINTYGKQVVTTWVFALNHPPDGDSADTRGVAKTSDGKPAAGNKPKTNAEKENEREKIKDDGRRDSVLVIDSDGKDMSAKDQSATKKNPVEAAPKASESADITDGDAAGVTEQSLTRSKSVTQKAKAWTAYLPSLRRVKQQTDAGGKPEDSSDGNDNKKWTSYIPSGQGFSTYLPSKDSIASFAAIHQRDPNVSFAEQLYQFSKTPVGAAGISAATGSSTTQTLIAAYNAYVRLLPSSSTPPMEYMSLPHTCIGTRHIVPQVHDTLLSNLRRPLLTMTEDTSARTHDALSAACDTYLYASLGVQNPEEHNSCAVNLVLALNELNDNTGLQGTKRIGADITVNNAPTPLHLFMNTQYGPAGEIKILEPEGPKGSYVKFRAETDVVVVMSACPMNFGSQNGGRCMAANFVVEGDFPKPSKVSKKKTDGVSSGETMETKDQGKRAISSPGPERRRPRKLERRSGDVKQVLSV